MKNKPNLKIKIVKEELTDLVPICICCRKNSLSLNMERKRKQYFLVGVGELCEKCWKVNKIKKREFLRHE
tara:strand:- start:147 stop:356 length:210 start_codon:yes stop_codon:yes gene_type:complete